MKAGGRPLGAAENEILKAYLAEMVRVHATGAGTGETSYYGALQGALNAVGDTLRPRVYCLSQMSGAAGLPDFGLFTDMQSARGGRAAVWAAGGPIPERGVVEVDDVPAPLSIKRGSVQVANYLGSYGLVLVSNYRDFELVESLASGAPRVVEQFSFGLNETAFFGWAADRRRPEDEPMALSFVEFLRRVLGRRAPLAEPRDVAALLASYARDSLARVMASAGLPALSTLRDALGESLGLHFQPGEKGDHFFQSTLVQTLFYGLFSAWATHARESDTPFDWRTATWTLQVPAIRALFEQVATPGRLGRLDLIDVLGWAADALNRVDRRIFFDRFDEANAVQHFYEPFLAAFDPDLRRALGVWYTPPEIVHYMVERVDRVLRDELGIADGLADSNVWVLDPCTGTGSYLVAVLRRIQQTLQEKGVGAALAPELKEAATQRIAGFEVLPAPFVIAHWQVATLLAAAGSPLNDAAGERASIYLTNALTGWQSAGAGSHLPFPELERERDLANIVKREAPVLVILGNPPYSAFDGTSPEEEGDLVERYKEGLGERWGVRKYNLDDLYVRFFRVAERRIADVTGRGMVCFITNASYLSYRSYTVMRDRLVGAFDRIWIDAMNGDSRQTGKLTPDGRPDPSVFSTDLNPEGIRVGTAISMLVRKDAVEPKQADVKHREFWGATKRTDLGATLSLDKEDFENTYVSSQPSAENRFKLAPDATLAVYRAWPSLAELTISEEWSGVAEMRKGALIAHDRATIEGRMARYCDPAISLETLTEENCGPIANAARYDALEARNRLLAAGGLVAGRFAPIVLRPFDRQWAFHTDVRPIWNEPRPELAAQQGAGNIFIVTRLQSRKPDEGIPVFATRDLPGYHSLDPNAHPFPVKLHLNATGTGGLALHDDEVGPNLSMQARQYLSELELAEWLAPNHPQADAVWFSALAIAYAPAWLDDNEEGILDDWPRMPLPSSAEQLLQSARLGRRVFDLLDTTIPVPGVTVGTLDACLREIAALQNAGGGSASTIDLAVTARWGTQDRRGAVMPGPGQVLERDYDSSEGACGDKAPLLGVRTNDVYLNQNIFWGNVPQEVWDFTIGGYQVLKKWLSYRVLTILGRPLTLAEVNHFRDTARRIAALRLLAPELDRNYRACADGSYPWRTIAAHNE